jgi:membrane protein implicated in regulation of membrane protease activity
MADWIMWLVAAGVVVGLELFTGTFYLLMIAIGLLAGGLLAFMRVDLPGQLLAAAVVGIVATILLRRSRYGKAEKRDAASDPNVNMDIGQSVNVPAWQDGAARVMYRGALWDVELAPDAAPVPGVFRIIEVRGSRLIVGA